MLKIKALIYRLTGIYLAKKDELKYLNSKEYIADIQKMTFKNKNSLSYATLQSILLGTWQAKHGFTRKYKSKRRK